MNFFAGSLAATAVVPAAAALSSMSEIDPAFAAIAEHDAAIKARNAALAALHGGDIYEGTPAMAACDEELRAVKALFAVRPTTVAGVAALLQRFGSPIYPDCGPIGSSLDNEAVICWTVMWDGGEWRPDVVRQMMALAAVLGLPSNDVAVATAAPSPVGVNPDAKLLAIIDQYLAVQTEYDQANAIWDQAYGRQKAENPMPDVLRVRPEDEALGLCVAHGDRLPEAYDIPYLIDGLRAEKYMVVEKIEPPSGTRFHYVCGGEVVRYIEPSDAARARALEIVQAFNAWQPSVSETRSMRATGRKIEKLAGSLHRIERQIVKTPAQSIAGLVAKAKIAARLASQEDESENYLARSISRDVLAIETATVTRC
jgi:hypothetical protein